MRRRMLTVLFGLLILGLVLPATVLAASPRISRISPLKGPIGTAVTITGRRLAAATSVTFNGKAATISSNTATTITVKVPAGASTGKIKVATPAGTATSATPFKVSLGILVSPASATPNGALKVAGSGFTHGKKVDLKFDTTRRTTITADAKGTFMNAVVLVPATAAVGRHTVTALDRAAAKSVKRPVSVQAMGPGHTLVYALDGAVTYLSNAASDVPSANAAQWLYDGLYMYSADLSVVPDLASAPATVSPDGLTWTIHLVGNATFQPTGRPLTADDVVFTYQLAASQNCTFNPSICLAWLSVGDSAGNLHPVFRDVTKIDANTVQFRLYAKYAPFATLILPGVFIDSKAAVEASYQRLMHSAGSIDDIAAAYLRLDIQRKPVGTGPFYVASPADVQPGQGLTFTQNPTYFRGPSTLSKVYLPIIEDSLAAADALKAGQINWQYQLTSDALG